MEIFILLNRSIAKVSEFETINCEFLQKLVGGYFEHLHIGDLVFTFNESGRIDNLPKTFFGKYDFYGSVLISQSSCSNIIGLSDVNLKRLIHHFECHPYFQSVVFS